MSEAEPYFPFNLTKDAKHQQSLSHLANMPASETQHYLLQLFNLISPALLLNPSGNITAITTSLHIIQIRHLHT
jgi:hypothetical protein